MSEVEKAVEIYGQGFACSQAVLGAFCEQFGLDVETAYKISSGFGGGMHLNKTCGVITGAFMVIGLKHGRTKADDTEAKVKTYKLMAEFTGKFKAKHKYIGCTALLGCNIATEDGLREAKEKDLFKQLCPDFVKTSAQILKEIL
ncbi:MAG: C_GCAxxG_C_C family protein [Planctomycetes bacterium]|nr:C_GCAxxG_C_C family protein [Planctomycetota bacterium]